MAEARSAVAEPRVTKIDEGRDSWHDFLIAWRKSIFRRYFRTRNSIRNGMWPTSLYNLAIAFGILCTLTLWEPRFAVRINNWLWYLEAVLRLPKCLPYLLRVGVIAWIAGIVFFILLMCIRQYLLRILLTYRGWMFERPNIQSKTTLIWAITVRLISGYQPSLYSCQKSLPRLPVPPLKQTLKKLIESLRPVSTDEEIEILKQESKEFEKSLGPKLQKILMLKSWWSQNYVTDWWEKYVYLMGRTPISNNSNYYCLDHSYWFASPSQVSRASNILHLVLKFKRMIDREELEPLVIRGTIPICMAQFERLLSTVRVPGEDVDEVLHFDSKDSKHIVVVSDNIYYKLDVYDSKDQILSPTSFENQIKWIMEDSNKHKETCTDEEKSISSLTALDRTEWARIRKKHFLSGVNHETMQLIEKSILLLWLPDYSPNNFVERGKWLLHGDGRSMWFDKSFNLVIFKNGRAGFNCEHSIADAPAMSMIWEYAMTKEVVEKVYDEDGHCLPLCLPFRQALFKSPQRLIWQVEPELGVKIQNAVTFAQTLRKNKLDNSTFNAPPTQSDSHESRMWKAIYANAICHI
ncbi:Carnitine O-palmitoyltransferase 1, liver isoform [Nymphon striatum]|nr:Carnitine O-palmitoyltransferase 1, liver isoform [Nymphon striatum]